MIYVLLHLVGFFMVKCRYIYHIHGSYGKSHLNQPLIFTGRRQVTPMLCEDSARHPLSTSRVARMWGIEVEETELIFLYSLGIQSPFENGNGT